jgi:uncharacterized protein YllA (UPF0747 family)
VQSAILPTLDYVAGPGEIGYWAQLRAVFERFGVLMPRVVPRPHVVLVTRRCAKLLGKHEIEIAEFLEGGGERFLERMASTKGSSRKQNLVELSGQIMSQLQQYVDEIEALDASLGKSAGRLKGKIAYELDKLNEKARTARKGRVAQVGQDMDELVANLLPYGKPQERVLNIFPYVMESGWSVLSRLLESVDVDRAGYHVMPV